EAGPDAPRVPEHFAAALEAARQGQQEEPENVDAVSAEAECLESMGEFEQAVEVRTRAMAKAHTRPAMHEALHYRWRLHYWTGSLEAALADVNRIEGDFGSSDEVSRTFAHLYPALIHAELGDSETAHRLAVAREDDDASTMDVVFAATTLRLLGSADAADDLLAQRAGLMESASEGDDQQAATWLRELYSFCSGDLPRDDLLALANRAARPRDLVAELQYHATAMALARGDRAQAMRDLEAAYRSFDGEENYTYHAKVLLWKMRADPAWPPWIQPAGDPFPSPNDNDRSTEVIESGEEPS
ncbi:MAG: hypothetical protein GY778_01060, partial [bacterium]|nr:hypothetical protein [bacterium]